jgi:hypothetical protein
MKEYRDTVFEFVKSQDDLEFALGDTLDIKTSIVLVLITFLATQSADFLRGIPPLSTFWHYTQIVSTLSLIVAGGLALYELFPREYMARMSPGKFLGWMNELSEFYKDDADAESKIVGAINDAELKKAETRFARNSAINAQKSKLLEWSFYFSLAALAINLLTLLRLSSAL